MPGFVNLPPEVRDRISAHLRRKVREAVASYWDCSEDEDTITGDLGATLRSQNNRVNVPISSKEEMSGAWIWGVRYTRFSGGRGSSPERFIGADLIFEISLRWPNGQTDTKSLLMQAKKKWSGYQERLYDQARTLSTWREAAAVLDYAPSGYTVYSLDDVLSAGGDRAKVRPGMDLADFLADQYLACKIGDTELRYDAHNRELRWATAEGKFVKTAFGAQGKITIEASTPDSIHSTVPNILVNRNYEYVRNDSIWRHRMKN